MTIIILNIKRLNMCDKTNLKDIKEYQELTFKQLNKLMEEECIRGSSKLCITKTCLGEPMKKILRDKGFIVCDLYSGGHTISW